MSSIMSLFFCYFSIILIEKPDNENNKYFKNLKPIVKIVHPNPLLQTVIYKKAPLKMIKSDKKSI